MKPKRDIDQAHDIQPPIGLDPGHIKIHFPKYGVSEYYWHPHISYPRDPGMYVIRIPGFGVFPGDSGFRYKLVNYFGEGRWNDSMPKIYFWCPLPR